MAIKDTSVIQNKTLLFSKTVDAIFVFIKLNTQ